MEQPPGSAEPFSLPLRQRVRPYPITPSQPAPSEDITVEPSGASDFETPDDPQPVADLLAEPLDAAGGFDESPAAQRRRRYGSGNGE
jgi:hypothetical protein